MVVNDYRVVVVIDSPAPSHVIQYLLIYICSSIIYMCIFSCIYPLIYVHRLISMCILSFMYVPSPMYVPSLVCVPHRVCTSPAAVGGRLPSCPHRQEHP